jgi:clan AA aspartic protease
MISGLVNAYFEPTIRFDVEDVNGQAYPVEATIDTGFNGILTLPPAVVNPMGLPWISRQRGMMADGNIYYFDTYQATIIWDGQPRKVEVQCNDVRPVVGTKLLQGYDLWIEFVPGGKVEIEARATP